MALASLMSLTTPPLFSVPIRPTSPGPLIVRPLTVLPRPSSVPEKLATTELV